MDITTNSAVKDADIAYLNSLFGDHIRNKEGIRLLELNQKVIGFYQISDFKLDSFVEGYQLDDYDFSLIEPDEYVLLENLFLIDGYQNQHIGSSIVEAIKEEYRNQNKNLILYSVAEAELFWIKQGFEEYDAYIYIYKLPQVLSM